MSVSSKRRGRQSYLLPSKPRVKSFAAIAGKKEGEGPLRGLFDIVIADDTLGEKSWERAESRMLEDVIRLCLEKKELSPESVDAFLGGDLLNQIVSASFAARQLGVPFLGLYGACSTMAESLLIGSMLIDGGFAQNVVCATCSHFSTAERQYRFPLEMGSVRPPYAQWTVTGAGATALTAEQGYPIAIESLTLGAVVDYNQNDENNMGAAMAPAAADTLRSHLAEMNRGADYYDLIVTGDLGRVGQALFEELCAEHGIELGGRYLDCGSEIFAPEQNLYSGGSGCGCSALVLNGKLLKEMERGERRRMLFMATGALLSPTTTLQGESIPGIAHAVSLEVC
ncbi:MAG: stage V sporulation protein AD [Christensenellaceae bacterium]|jgi:stage V sporulation protein AD|nr:stage V sporulation protein AD [Christensenellaceae bacterium]